MTDPKFTRDQIEEALRRAKIKHEVARPYIINAFEPFGEIMADGIWDVFEHTFRKTFEQHQ